jgi:hypothetical protein
VAYQAGPPGQAERSRPGLYGLLGALAYDHLSIPAMSSEVEGAFSGAKLNLPASRNQLKPDILEAQECVWRWLKAGL